MKDVPRWLLDLTVNSQLIGMTAIILFWLADNMIWPVEGLNLVVNMGIYLAVSHAIGLPVTVYLTWRRPRTGR